MAASDIAVSAEEQHVGSLPAGTGGARPRHSTRGRAHHRDRLCEGVTVSTAPQILSNTPGSFPWSVLHDRHPALIQKVRDGLPYPPETGRALDALAEEITGELRPLRPEAHDHRLWAEWGGDHLGKSWYDVPFLWAESYFYRKLLEAVGYFDQGPWRGVDPFEPYKSAELRGEELARDLAALDDLAALPMAEQDAAMLTASLWGNRADLGFQVSARLGQVGAGGAGVMVADQSAALWELLADAAPATVCLVADNAARELVPDLVLADHLLVTGRASTVVLHVKPSPYYVSDAMTSDVVAAVRVLAGSAGRAALTGRRLWQAMVDGTLAVRAHPFSCAPWSYDRMPGDLADQFAAASVTIMKGDLNYRRLVGDRSWRPDLPFDEVTAYFPGPVAALRALKSDVVVGVPDDRRVMLDATGEPWRTAGTHALVQLRTGHR
jgi:Damage-control phosphatase ARMT1-like domain